MTNAGSPAPVRVEDYALSLLLHDIGKFWERSSDAPRPAPAELALYCPHHPESGSYSHMHAALSARFIEDVVRIEGASRWGPRHHLPDVASRKELCAQLGDWLGAGETGADESRDAPNAATTPLRSIFSGLLLDGRIPEPKFLPLARLDSFQDSLIPRPIVPVSREDYRFHWNHFLNAIDKLGSPLSDLETWCALLQVFASRIPAATTNRQLKTIPDIDLYTHSRAVAALSVALFAGPLSQTELLALRSGFHSHDAEKLEVPLFTLVGAEVAGARRFLTGSGGPGAGHGIRGRALFLDLLAEEAARRFAARLGLPITSILELHGHRFILLAPPRAAWESVRDETEGLLAGEARGELGIEASSVDLTLADFRSGIGRPWLRLLSGLEDALRERLARLSRAGYDRVFGFVDRDGAPECGSCRGALEPAPPIGAEEPAEATGAEPRRCLLCSSLEGLGKSMGRARFLLRRRADEGDRLGYGKILSDLHSAVAEAVRADALQELSGRNGLEGIYSLGRLELEELAKAHALRPVSLGLRWAGGGGPTVLEGGARAVLAAGANGLERLLVLGIPPGGASLPRILGLSGVVHQFFAGWAAAALEKKPPDSLVLLASGGEGLLVAGDFREAVEFLKDLERGFGAFSGHPSLSFSAGLAAGGEFPGSLVESAWSDLESARRRLSQRDGAVSVPAAAAEGGPEVPRAPSSLTFLGTDLAFDAVPALEEVVGWIAGPDGPGGGAARGLLQVLRSAVRAHRLEEAALRTGGPGLSGAEVREAISWMRWRWSLAAGLQDLPGDIESRGRRDRLREWLLQDGARNIERLPLVIRWVELLMKGEGS